MQRLHEGEFAVNDAFQNSEVGVTKPLRMEEIEIALRHLAVKIIGDRQSGRDVWIIFAKPPSQLATLDGFLILPKMDFDHCQGRVNLGVVWVDLKCLQVAGFGTFIISHLTQRSTF